MTVFEDASAIVARYASEPGRQQVPRASVVVVSSVSRVEVASAIWRKQRIGELSPSQARTLVDAFGADLAALPEHPDLPDPPDHIRPADADTVTYLPVAVDTAVLDAAVALCGVHGLRAYDAVQLASAVRARAADSSVTEFVTYDVALHRAAAAEGFRVNQGRPAASVRQAETQGSG